MLARDEQAATDIQARLTQAPPNARARLATLVIKQQRPQFRDRKDPVLRRRLPEAAEFIEQNHPDPRGTAGTDVDFPVAAHHASL